MGHARYQPASSEVVPALSADALQEEPLQPEPDALMPCQGRTALEEPPAGQEGPATPLEGVVPETTSAAVPGAMLQGLMPAPMFAPVAFAQPLQPATDSRLDPRTEAVWRQVREAIERLEVSTGPAGVTQIRMDFSPQAIPGVQALVQQVAGRIQVDLIVSSEQSRRRLRTVIERELSGTAERLGRSVEVTLRSADDADDESAESLHAGA